MLSGFLLLLVNFPEVQNKIYQEISRVVGQGRQPCLPDRASMPYTQAVMLEALRYQSHLGLTATHTNSKDDVEFEGFLIPKNSAVSLQEISHYLDPLEFRLLHINSCCMPIRHYFIETTKNSPSRF
jgi:cytochrome P450